jgi:hypothetical protein
MSINCCLPYFEELAHLSAEVLWKGLFLDCPVDRGRPSGLPGSLLARIQFQESKGSLQNLRTTIGGFNFAP